MDQPRDQSRAKQLAARRIALTTHRALRGWRVGAAIGVLVLWVAGLALLARRELLKPASTRLAEAALRVQPSSDYYVIERDDSIVGGASAEVDTTGYGIVLRQHLFGNLIEGDADSLVVRVRSMYTPALAFGGFKIEAKRGADSVVLAGLRSGDSLLIVTMEGPREAQPPRSIVAGDPLFLPTAAAMPVVLLHRPRPGLTAEVNIFDPLLQRARTLPLRVAEESVFVVVDSAALHRESRRWVPARRDTVRAWLLVSDSTTMRAWVDRAGRIVEVTDGRGTRARRTAYEIAYENWRILRAEAVGRR